MPRVQVRGRGGSERQGSGGVYAARGRQGTASCAGGEQGAGVVPVGLHGPRPPPRHGPLLDPRRRLHGPSPSPLPKRIHPRARSSLLCAPALVLGATCRSACPGRPSGRPSSELTPSGCREGGPTQPGQAGAPALAGPQSRIHHTGPSRPWGHTRGLRCAQQRLAVTAGARKGWVRCCGQGRSSYPALAQPT